MKGHCYTYLLRIIVLCLLSCWYVLPVSAQRYPFFNLNVESGLIQSQATCLAQDKFGHLWIGTLGGLSRYDGKSFVNYSVGDGMLDNVVNALASDKDGNLWIGGPEGISKFDGRQFRHYNFHSLDTPSNTTVAEINITRAGAVWFRAGGRVYRIFKDSNTRFRIPDARGYITAFLPDSNQVWFARAGGVVYRYRNNRWDSLAFNIPGMITPPTVFKIYKDSKKQILLATNAGLYRATDSGIYVMRYNGEPAYYLPPLLSVTEDKTGNLWLGTSSGAVRITGETIQYHNKRTGLSDNAITNILTDAEGNVWLASDGQGIFRFSGTQFTVLDESMGLPSAQVMSIAATESGRRLYVGTFDAGLFIYEGGTVYAVTLPLKPAPAITAIKIRKGKKINNELWFGTRGAGLWKYNGATFSSFGVPTLPSNSITSLYVDDSNRLFIGFVNGAMYYDDNIFYRLQIQNTAVQDFITIGYDSILMATTNGIKLFHNNEVFDFKTNTALDSISPLCFTLNGDVLWAGSSDHGIVYYNLKTKKTSVINKGNGLQSDFIYNIITDDEGNIWTGTGYGIHKISMRGGKPVITFYGKGQGVAGMESNHNAVLKMPDGSIWFGTTNGALHYRPQSKTIRPQPISIVMQSIKLFGEPIADTNYYRSTDLWYHVPQELRLPPKKNNITFNFQAISLSGLEQVKYRYRMEGLDAPWSDWSPVNTVTYSALPPGKYTLIVESVAGDGDVRTLRYPFEIITPFQQTIWFKLLILAGCILIGVTLQYIANRRKQNRLALLERLRREEQGKVRIRTAEDFHDEVGNKLTRINVLTNVLKEKLGSSPPPDTRRILDQIQENTSQLYSGTRDILWSLKPTNDNLYEILHRLRDFGGELFQDTDTDFVFIGTDERWRRYKLPMDMSRNLIMIFKEALNNSLKYSGAKLVQLEVYLKEDDALQIILTDNGKGFDTLDFKKGHGIDNMKVRAKRINGILYIDSRPGKGTIINLNFRLPPKEKRKITS